MADRSYYASNKIGVAFSTVPYDYLINPPPVNNQAKVYAAVVIDTINWVEISAIFIADSVYKYNMIGNFFKDSLATKITNDTITSFALMWAYYYVDDVCVSTDSATSISETGVVSFTPSVFTIYPNPITNEINVISNSIQQYDCYFYSVIEKK